MIRKSLFCLLLTAAMAVAGCKPSSVSTTPEPQVGPLVGGDELQSSGRPWLLDALRVVRPSYFNPRGQATLIERRLDAMIVVINGMVIPDLDLVIASYAGNYNERAGVAMTTNLIPRYVLPAVR